MNNYLRGKLANTVDYDIIVSEFQLLSRYYVHFRTNTLEKVLNPLMPQLWIK